MMLANIVRSIHILIVVFVFIGPFILPHKLLPYFLLFILLIFLDWNDFDGMCILTKIEHYLIYGVWDNKSPTEGGPEFFRPILQYLGFNLTRTEADRLNNFLFLISWGIAFIRYVWFPRINYVLFK